MTVTPARGALTRRLRVATSRLAAGLAIALWTGLGACLAWLIVLAIFSPWPELPDELQWDAWVEWTLLAAIWLLLVAVSFGGVTRARGALLGGLPPSLWSEKVLWRQVHAVYEREPSDGPLPQELLDQLADPRFKQERPAGPVGDVWRRAVVFHLNPALLPRSARRHYPCDDYGRELQWIAWRNHWEPEPGYDAERWARCASLQHAVEICETWVGDAGRIIDPRIFRSGTGTGERFAGLVRTHEDFGNKRSAYASSGPGPGGLPRNRWTSERWRPFR